MKYWSALIEYRMSSWHLYTVYNITPDVVFSSWYNAWSVSTHDLHDEIMTWKYFPERNPAIESSSLLDSFPENISMSWQQLSVGSSHKVWVMWSFDATLVVGLKKLLNKQLNCQWWEMPWWWCRALRGPEVRALGPWKSNGALVKFCLRAQWTPQNWRIGNVFQWRDPSNFAWCPWDFKWWQTLTFHGQFTFTLYIMSPSGCINTDSVGTWVINLLASGRCHSKFKNAISEQVLQFK